MKVKEILELNEIHQLGKLEVQMRTATSLKDYNEFKRTRARIIKRAIVRYKNQLEKKESGVVI